MRGAIYLPQRKNVCLVPGSVVSNDHCIFGDSASHIPAHDSVIVYREVERTVNPAALLSECTATLREISSATATPHARATRLLIDFGELEAAIADALFPHGDDVSPIADAWRAASLRIARLFLLSAWGQRAGRLRAGARDALALTLPLASSVPTGSIRLRVPEGYAYYALYPETYAAAADLLDRDVGPSAAICIGLRSIGTSLSAVVCAALQAKGWSATALTLRPRGHPFERRPFLSAELARRIHSFGPAYMLIVDEGPGLSGSSLCGTAEVLAKLGVQEERIVLFPSWLPDEAAFVSATARDCWRRYRKFCCSFDEMGLAHRILSTNGENLSAGRWRRRCYPDQANYPAVQPQHERRKYLAGSGPGRQMVYKFAGLGRYGAAKQARAERLAEAGFTPPVLGLRDGFLIQEFVIGRPLSRGDADQALMRTAVEYLAFLRTNFVIDESMALEPMLQMIDVNVSEGIGRQWRDRLGNLDRFLPMLSDVQPVAIDGRLMPHEWLRTSTGILKTDALDHHDDHFFPGPQDVAWDVAAFGAEFSLSQCALRGFAELLASMTADRSLPTRLSFYEVAYLSCRLGYVTLGAQALGGSAEGGRMALLRHRYRRELRSAITRLQGQPSALVTGRRRGPLRATVSLSK